MNAHKLCEVGVKPKDLLKKSPLIFSGHFHLNEERDYDTGKIVYVGSPFQLDFGERECKKGYYIIDFNDLSYNFYINSKSPVHKKYSITEILENGTINPVYKKDIANNFIKLVVDTNTDQKILDDLVSTINSLAPNTLTVDQIFNIDSLEQESTDLSGIDITKAIIEFVNLLDIKEKEDVIKRSLFLYNQIKHD
jgi:DNA repair exonuclease SbcCD nuclease subunit